MSEQVVFRCVWDEKGKVERELKAALVRAGWEEGYEKRLEKKKTRRNGVLFCKVPGGKWLVRLGCAGQGRKEE